MEQRDLLKDQIEQLGKVLAKILSDFLSLKSTGNVTQGIEIANERLQGELGIDIKKLVTFNRSGLKEYLETHKLTASHLEILSEYLKEMGMIQMERNKAQAKIKLEKAVELLDIADENSKTLSFDRIKKKNEIKNILQQCL